MAVKLNIRKIVSFTMWSVVGAGVLVLLIAAIRYRNGNTCKGFQIGISGPSGQLFIDKKEIAALLTSAGAGRGQDRPIQSFDLRRLESTLEKNVWIRKAQLFFDNNGILQASVEEREPATRIFTSDGNSFYIDSNGMQLPLSEKFPARLPVFTGYPSSKIRLKGKDSLLTRQVIRMSSFIRNDPFWMDQVAQVDILPDANFELEPLIGDHRVSFGDGSDIEQKFHRLLVFYKEVLSRIGFDKYGRIDVSYAGQVIGTRKGSGQTRFDSLQGLNNIRRLIQSAQQLQPDTIRQQNIRPLERNTMTEQALTNYDLIPATGDTPATSDTPVAGNPTIVGNAATNGNVTSIGHPAANGHPTHPIVIPVHPSRPSVHSGVRVSKPKPKAVMPKRKKKTTNKK